MHSYSLLICFFLGELKRGVCQAERKLERAEIEVVYNEERKLLN